MIGLGSDKKFPSFIANGSSDHAVHGLKSSEITFNWLSNDPKKARFGSAVEFLVD